MRAAAALVVASGVAALAALILGEYELSVLTGVVAGVLVGLAVAGSALAVSRAPARLMAVAVAVLAAGAMLWAGWITVRHRDEAIPTAAWAGAVAGAIAAGLRIAAARATSLRSERSG